MISRRARASRLVVGVGVCLLVIGSSACGSTRGGLSVRVSEKSFTIAIVDGRGGVTELGGKDAPFALWTLDGVEHLATHVIRQAVRVA